jgi:NAD-dependent deacetylase
MSAASAHALHLSQARYVLVLTGAGVSAESGVPTFRSGGALWERYPIDKVATPRGFAEDPGLVWRFYSDRRRQAARCNPNAGHYALARLEDRLGDRFLLVTQNIDGLHRKAGSQRLIELHGNLFLSRCSRCDREPFPDERSYRGGAVPTCELCQEQGEESLLRPHVVWFDERLDPGQLDQVQHFIDRASLESWVFVAVGTSGAVFPAAAMVDVAREAGATTWLINADPAENLTSFDNYVQGLSGEVLPHLIG